MISTVRFGQVFNTKPNKSEGKSISIHDGFPHINNAPIAWATEEDRVTMQKAYQEYSSVASNDFMREIIADKAEITLKRIQRELINKIPSGFGILE